MKKKNVKIIANNFDILIFSFRLIFFLQLTLLFVKTTSKIIQARFTSHFPVTSTFRKCRRLFHHHPNQVFVTHTHNRVIPPWSRIKAIIPGLVSRGFFLPSFPEAEVQSFPYFSPLNLSEIGLKWSWLRDKKEPTLRVSR